MEVHKLLPLLVDTPPDVPSFHVVALSLPGFGFSEAPKKKGFGSRQYAEVCLSRSSKYRRSNGTFRPQVANKLMLSLGYNEYGMSSRLKRGSHLGQLTLFFQLYKEATGVIW